MIRYPLITEKAVGLIEKENKIVFIVTEDTTKKQVKDEVEKAYEVKVAAVNVIHMINGRKKAYVKLRPEFKAADVAAKLKIM